MKFFKQSYEPQRLLGCTPASKGFYTTAIKKFTAFLGRDACIEDVTEENVLSWLEDMSTCGHSPVTCNGQVKHVITLLRFAKHKRQTDLSVPDVRRLPENTRLPNAWSMEEIEKILMACQLIKERYMGIDGAAWWHALVLVLIDTGGARAPFCIPGWTRSIFRTSCYESLLSE